MEEIIMKTYLITIHLAVLISVISITSYNVSAKERKLSLIEYSFLDEKDDGSNFITGWMMNPNYFHQSENEIIESTTNLENWMLDIHHFYSPVLTENSQNNEVIENWMKRKGHFHSVINTHIASRFSKIDNRLGEVKVIVAKR
jgi:hypothetical protein